MRFLAYSGVRIGEAKYVTWADANFTRRELHVRGDPETATKNGETRFVPMISELEQMLTELRAERPNDPPTATVMRVFECQNSMSHAAEKIGMGHDIGLTELTKHAILSYPLPDQQTGEKFAAFTYLHSDAQNPICGTAHNVASPEMLYISGSSGAQFDERARQLRGTDDVVSAIESAISQQ